jgi:cell pole-organizing protein PopZ
VAEEEAQDEPTMEKILSSIREIISEDGEPVDEDEELTEPGPTAEPEPEPEPEPGLVAAPKPEPAVEEAFDENVLELTDAVEEDGDIFDLEEPLPESAVARPAATGTPTEYLDNNLVSDPTADVTTAAFSALAGAVSDAKGVALGRTHQTLEELVRDLLRPMLKEWLDANLEPIVARAVEREITKLAGRADKD